jgi:hypothetical protein
MSAAVHRRIAPFRLARACAPHFRTAARADDKTGSTRNCHCQRRKALARTGSRSDTGVLANVSRSTRSRAQDPPSRGMLAPDAIQVAADGLRALYKIGDVKGITLHTEPARRLGPGRGRPGAGHLSEPDRPGAPRPPSGRRLTRRRALPLGEATQLAPEATAQVQDLIPFPTGQTSSVRCLTCWINGCSSMRFSQRKVASVPAD